MTYKLCRCERTKEVLTDIIIRKSDNAVIPFDEDNKDAREYLEWVAEGNTAEAAD